MSNSNTGSSQKHHPQTQSHKTVPKDLERKLTNLFADICKGASDDELKSTERLFTYIEKTHWAFVDKGIADDYNLSSKFETFVELLCHCIPSLRVSANKYGINNLIKRYEEYKNSIPVNGCTLMNADMTRIVVIKQHDKW